MRKLCYFLLMISLVLLFTACDVDDGPDDYKTDGSTWELIGENKMPALHDGHFFDEDFGFIVGDDGFLAKTHDGGDNWEIIDNGDFDAHMLLCHFIDENNGFVAGRKGRLYTCVNGEWSNLSENRFAEMNFVKKSFVTPEYGFIIGHTGQLYKTTNGGVGEVGLGWEDLGERVYTNTVGQYKMRAVNFIDEDYGFVGGVRSNVMKTTDGGYTWENFPSPTAPSDTFTILDLWFFSPDTGIKVGERRSIRKTEDGGTTWFPLNVAISDTTEDIVSIMFKDRMTGYISTEKGRIFMTADGGNTWSNASEDIAASGINGTIDEIFFINDDFGWILGYDNSSLSGAFKTSHNNGLKWTYKSYGFNNNLNGVSFANEMNGWAVGDDGYIFHTIDGGETWKHQTNPVAVAGLTRNLMDVCFINSDKGWAVGENNTIIKTTNGGSEWTRCTVSLPGIVSFLRCVHFIDENVGWVGGSFNILLKTIDGGETWEVQDMDEFPVTYHDIYFKNNSEGYIVGEVGYFLKTTDSGNTWVKKETDVFNTLRGMDVDGDNIWVTGNQKVIHSADDGETWEDFNDFISSNNLQANFESITSLGSNKIWAIGSYGYRIHSADGGDTWYRQNSPNISFDLNSSCKIGLDFVVAVGDSGTALRLLK